MSRRKVFIAHSSDDEELARDLRTQLESRGVDCWLCYDILPGRSVHTVICEQMQKADRCIVLVTPAFLQSQYFQFELSLAFTRQNELSVVFCIPIYRGISTADLPYQLVNLQCIKGDDMNSGEFLERLETAIKNDTKTVSQLQVTHTGVGLAWSYFYGFLNIVLPGLPERIKKSRFATCYPKMFIIIPSSCFCPPDVAQLDGNFTHVGHIDYKFTRSGNVERDYKSSVYRFTYCNEDGKQVLQDLVLEFATPLLSLYEMKTYGLANLSEAAMKTERIKFREVLIQILNFPKAETCRDKFIIVDFRDDDEQTSSAVYKRTTLAHVIQQSLESDIIRHKAVDSLNHDIKQLSCDDVL